MESLRPMDLLPLLATADLVYRTQRSREELACLARVFAEDLAGASFGEVAAAFALHRRRCIYFPTPAHIIALLPECRTTPRLAEGTGSRTPGYGAAMCQEILKLLRRPPRASPAAPGPDTPAAICRKVLDEVQRQLHEQSRRSGPERGRHGFQRDED